MNFGSVGTILAKKAQDYAVAAIQAPLNGITSVVDTAKDLGVDTSWYDSFGTTLKNFVHSILVAFHLSSDEPATVPAPSPAPKSTTATAHDTPGPAGAPPTPAKKPPTVTAQR